ncbi:aldehyde dehydrogenase family protein [Alphaproteobacteria bacterium KMM 3653]|uniref:Aldehyde dehydrogenase family protein n=2 Tax=Harenicola maris TaxID=2841044 RepID=A0AAP2CMP0_9RHOB|nr:aldehyde dehydrogenase family protein [Harenicola maris]
MKRECFYINGQWQKPIKGGAALPVYSSITGEVFESVPAGTAEDADAAVRAASKALPAWAAMGAAERAKIIGRIAQGLRDRADVIAPLIAEEVGMPLEGARGYQTLRAADALEDIAVLATKIAYEEPLGESLVIREPVGVVAGISPSNFPLLLSLNKVGAALAVGCTMVLKAPETAPGSLFYLADAAEEAGLPPGVLNIITGFGPEIGEPLASHPLVDMISFTGSTGVGKLLLGIGAQTIKRAHMELGGKSAAIVLEDADLDSALPAAIEQAFINAGQVCFAWSRLLVPRAKLARCEEILRDVVSRYVVGDPLDPATTLGPVVTRAATDRVRKFVSQAVSQNARIVTGGIEAPKGLSRGYFLQPTVLSDVDNRMPIAQEEIFGPVVSVIAHDGEDDAVRIANDSVFGLHGAVFSGDHARALGVARRIRTGQVDLNGFKLGMTAPFGGFKQSGLGRELGKFGLEEYLEVKSIQL